MTLLRNPQNDAPAQEPGADADYIYEKIRNSFRTGELEPLAQALQELQRDHRQDAGYPQDSEFFDRASQILLSDQIRWAAEAVALRTDPELATGELLLRNEGVRRFMAEAPRFRQEAEHIFQSVRMRERSILPLSRERAEELLREAAGGELPEPGRRPDESGEAALSVGRRAKETFLKIRQEFPHEEHRDLDKFANLNLAVVAAAAHAARSLLPDRLPRRR